MMVEDYQEEHMKKMSRVRSFMDFAMGVIFFLAGVFFLVYRYFGINLFKRDPSNVDFVIGGLFIAYGLWRIYRGYKKDYYIGSEDKTGSL